MTAISIIIPTYNRIASLLESIQSVLDQTFQDFEIIVIDDGSTDGTKEKLLSELGRDKRIRYHWQQNKGRSAARNSGIRMARGEFTAFLDSDDLWLQDKLETQVSALRQSPDYGMSYTYTYISHSTSGSEISGIWPYAKFSGWLYPQLMYIRNNYITTPTVMARTSILKDTNGFKEDLHVCEDLDLWRRIAIKHRILLVEKPLSIVRIRKSERANIEDSFRARMQYYKIAFADDPLLPIHIRKNLVAEMFVFYAKAALLRGETKTFRSLVIKGLSEAPSQVAYQCIVNLGEMGSHLFHKIAARLGMRNRFSS